MTSIKFSFQDGGVKMFLFHSPQNYPKQSRKWNIHKLYLQKPRDPYSQRKIYEDKVDKETVSDLERKRANLKTCWKGPEDMHGEPVLSTEQHEGPRNGGISCWGRQLGNRQVKERSYSTVSVETLHPHIPAPALKIPVLIHPTPIGNEKCIFWRN